MEIKNIELIASKRLSELECRKPPWIEVNRKQNISSEQCRLAGNEAFKKRNFDTAIEFYNGALRYAPSGSEEIALNYGNRSAVYCEIGKYALALENIKLARKNGFPSNKMAQLDVREQKCQKLMEKFGPNKVSIANSFFKLSYPPNKKIPFIIDCLELHKSEKYGRHIVTTQDLNTGDIIAIEPPAFSWTNFKLRGLFCAFCTKKNSGSLIPCLHCTSVMYCSAECQKKNASFHLGTEAYKTASESMACQLKMQLGAFHVAGGVDELLELLKDNENKSIFDFDFSDPDDPSYEKNMLVALNGLWKPAQARESDEILAEQLMNFAPITEKNRTAEERNLLLKFITGQIQIRCFNMLLSEGSHHGIFLFNALLNHSCLPNAYKFKFEEKSVTVVARPIKAGEQLFVNYGALAAAEPKRSRLMSLQKYSFKCDCDACVHDYSFPFPCKDRRFILPKFSPVKAAEAVKQFEKNCKYIDINDNKMPCQEVSMLIAHNTFLVECIADALSPFPTISIVGGY